MEKCFHPISGEPMYMATVKEKEIIDVALMLMLENNVSSRSSECDGYD